MICSHRSILKGSIERQRFRLPTMPFFFQLFAKLYGLAGSASQLTMVNSSWTEDHIVNLWGDHGKVHKVYPPCDTKEFREIEVTL